MENKKIPVLCDNEHCTGCMACLNSCPSDAISMRPSEEGFYRPVVDVEKCVGCLLCEKRCPVIQLRREEEKTADSAAGVFAAWHKDSRIREQSSSGGAFSALAEAVLDDGGYVVGAAYDADMRVRHLVVDNERDQERLRLSKYVQSDIGDTFRTIRRLLREDKKVLFVGTPCQTAGLKAYLSRDYDRLICCDFICHGVPSPLLFSRWLDWLQKDPPPSVSGKIMNLNFRDKRKGWYDALRVVTLEDGSQRVLKGRQDAYFIGFNANNNLQPCCYHCDFLGFPRYSDITLADYWGIGKHKPFGHKEDIEKGVSLVIANTDRGADLVKSCSSNLLLFERDLEDALKGNFSGIRSCKRPEARDDFYKDLAVMTFDEACDKYMTPDMKTRLVKFMREYLPRLVLEYIRMRGQK